MAIGSGKKDTDADDDVDEGKHAQFAAGAAVDVDGEDPNMLRYIEQELAKRRGAGGDEGGDGAGPSGGGAKSAEERLWDTPDELSMKKTEGEETADRWLTGIVEVQQTQMQPEAGTLASQTRFRRSPAQNGNVLGRDCRRKIVR